MPTVLGLSVEDFMERRLQTQVAKSGLAKSIHHARTMVRQRHIRVGEQMVNVASFMVRSASQKHIALSAGSSLADGNRAGRNKRKKVAAKAAKKASAGDDE